MPDHATQRVIRKLLSYVRANPTASDTAEGIARWWLNPEEWVDVDELMQALAVLVHRGILAERVTADDRRRYRRIATDEELEALLDEMQQPDGTANGLPH